MLNEPLENKDAGSPAETKRVKKPKVPDRVTRKKRASKKPVEKPLVKLG